MSADLPPPVPRKTYGWLWYFALLVALTIVSLTILIRYNLSRQLTLDKLATARELWQHKRPAHYDLEIVQQGTVAETRRVHIRSGKVVSGVRDGLPLEPRLYGYSDMDAWFGFLEENLQNDAQPGKPRTYTVATFDAEDGHITHYIRRVMGTTERVEVQFSLKKPQEPS
jgi:hypothetical protein